MVETVYFYLNMVKERKGTTSPEHSGGKCGDIILNACLSFIHSLMLTKNKGFVQEETLSGFDLQEIKKARKVLFIFCEPTEKYAYNGPNQSSDREKATHAFETTFKKMKELDAAQNKIVFACPSHELHLLPQKVADIHSPCRLEFERMQNDLQELKRTFHSFTNILTSKQSLPVPNLGLGLNDISTEPAPAISAQMRERINSSSSMGKRRKLSENADDYISCEEDADNDDSFQFQGPQRRKIARRDKKIDDKSASPAQKSAAVTTRRSSPILNTTRLQNKREAVWGKGKSNAASSFRGVPLKVPQSFLYKCDPGSEEGDVKEHLKSEGIKVTSVKQISNVSARYKSFVVSVEKREDFDKLISGLHIPESVGVRRYFPRREDSDMSTKNKFSRQMAELNALGSLRESSADVPAQSASSQPMQISSPNNSLSHPVSNMIDTASAQEQTEVATRTEQN